jgi:hypothetical protein
MCSRDEIKAYLHNLSSCNNLTSNPKENHSRMEQIGSERALFGFSAVLVENEQEREKERVWGYLYPSLPETSRWESGTRKLRVYIRILRTKESGDSGPNVFCRPITVTRILRVYVRILRTFCPDIPD